MAGKSLLPDGYGTLLAEVKQRIRAAETKAVLSANRELILLYWHIGRAVVAAQSDKRYGKRVVEMLSRDLRREFPAMQGFTANNVWRMRAFYAGYAKAPGKLAQPVQELDRGGPPEELAVLPWGHNILLLQKLKGATDRLWYARACLEHGWSRNVLAMQIESRLHERQGRAVTNFAATLPAPQSDLAVQALKDPYVFDFLTLDVTARERELELGLLDHIQKFLVELGVGFSFVGRQYPLEVAGEDYFLDLLFYHLRLRCFVVVDLKMEAFKPEFAGKMNFYLSAVDEQLRHEADQPSIGLLLCREKERIVVEYALRDVKKPIGVSEWRTRLVDTLPKTLRPNLPTIAEIEAELGRTKPGSKKVGGKSE
jgi:predicted nuclease of restriction endonuclease-like (RecB) superfamily